MADRGDTGSVRNALVSQNIFNMNDMKKEERQDNSVDEKVDVSETSIAYNAELQDYFWHDKIKQYELSTTLDNIKIEFSSSEGSEVYDSVKMGQGISADDIKIDFDNGMLYCEHCEAYYEDYCIECGMLAHILNKNPLNSADKGTRAAIPNDILDIQDCLGQTEIYATRIIPEGVKFGPFTGLTATECPWEMKGEKFVLDKNKSRYLNWMQYVNPTRNISDHNLRVVQCEDNIYYQSTRQIQAGEELLVYFGEEYSNSPNNIVRLDFVTINKDIIKDVFACTFCCLGFSSKSHLAKHKTLCVEDAAGRFSIEELTQCRFCKIQLDPKEYFEHHMPFCCDRNARMCVLSTAPSTKQTAAALNGRKRCLREIYKCGQCKYRTKYQADLKEHTNNQHYKVKMYKCGVCSKRFKNIESLRLHVENTHAYVGGKNDQEHPMTSYENTHIEVEQSMLLHQKKIFKCLLCVFRAKYKRSIKTHIKTHHLKQFDYKCDYCEFRTNYKLRLEVHIKTKHTKEFDFKCDSCEFRTNYKLSLEVHIKTKHTKEFDFKCDSCEFRTNYKNYLEVHIKTTHTQEFDFKCDSCEFRTNKKNHLEVHINTKHTKEFYFKCDSCEFRTNYKLSLEVHIKTKHTKEFDFKCDSCEFRTNYKKYLEVHIKTKHTNEFDFKCDSCEFRTNSKNHLKVHIKTKHTQEFDSKCASCEFRTNHKNYLEEHIKTHHLKQFDFKCDSCEFRTNRKSRLKRHIKSKHLEEFDFKCDYCKFRTNNNKNLEVHIKTKHTKEFDFKCDSCEFRTNSKNHLEVHINAKHTKEFDFKCDSCEFRTNHKSSLERHIKSKYLKQLDYKCDSCEFETNNKGNLKHHIKTKHNVMV